MSERVDMNGEGPKENINDPAGENPQEGALDAQPGSKKLSIDALLRGVARDYEDPAKNQALNHQWQSLISPDQPFPENFQDALGQVANFYYRLTPEQREVFEGWFQLVGPTKEALDANRIREGAQAIQRIMSVLPNFTEPAPGQQSPDPIESSRIVKRTIEMFDPDTGAIIPFEDGYETVYIVKGGLLQETKIPREAGEKKRWMNWILARLEKEFADVEGDPTIKEDLEELYLIIGQLNKVDYISKHKEDKNLKIGKELHDELRNRLKFHQIFLSFAGDAGSIADVRKAVDQIGGDQFKLLFNIPEFVAALTYYEKYGQDYAVDRTSLDEPVEESYKRFRKRADNFVKAVKQRPLNSGTTVFEESGIKVDTNIFDKNSIKEENIEWARNLAERFWRISARRITQTEGRLITNKKGKLAFEDTYQKGEYFLARLLRLREWEKTGSIPAALRAHMELIDNVDLNECDFIEQFIDDDAKIAEKSGVDINDAIYEETVRVGNEEKKVKRVNFMLLRWGERKDSNDHRIDFSKIYGSDNPMEFWTRERLNSPDNVRKVLLDAEKPDQSFLLQPSSQTLIALKGVFEYLEDKQYPALAQILSNFIDFLRTDEAKEMGLLKPDRAAIDTIIARTGKEFRLTPEESLRVANEKLGKGVMANLLLAFDYFPADEALQSFLWEFLKDFFTAVSKG